MKTGRNDPCPCGSGKKYKKCCLEKDKLEAATRPAFIPSGPSLYTTPNEQMSGRTESSAYTSTALAAPSEPVLEAPPQPKDPIEEKRDARCEEFESLDEDDDNGRIEVFLKTLDDRELITDDMAYEMLSCLHGNAVARGERGRYAEWVGMLRDRHPEVFEKSAPYYLSTCLEDALSENRLNAVRPLAREIGLQCGRDLDIAYKAFDGLAYHGQLSALVDAFRVGLPGVKESTNVFPQSILEFANNGADYEIYDYVEHTNAPDPADPVLLERIKYFIEEPDLVYVRKLIDDLSGKCGREWTMVDFEVKKRGKKSRRDDDSEETDNLFRLINEFVGYLRREEGVPYSKGNLVRRKLYRYLTGRALGEFKPRLSMLEQMEHPHRKPPKPPTPIHPVCPERVTFEACLSDLLHMFNMLVIRAAALFEAMPAWLRFLETRHLIDSDIRRRVIKDLFPLQELLLKLWDSYTDDPAVRRETEAWPANAARELSASVA
jgi:hypothetical protein